MCRIAPHLLGGEGMPAMGFVGANGIGHGKD